MSDSCRGFQRNDHRRPMRGKTILAAVIHALHERRTRLPPTQRRRTSGAKRRPSPPFVLSYAAPTQLLYLRSLLERHSPASLEGSIEDGIVKLTHRETITRYGDSGSASHSSLTPPSLWRWSPATVGSVRHFLTVCRHREGFLPPFNTLLTIGVLYSRGAPGAATAVHHRTPSETRGARGEHAHSEPHLWLCPF
jgi:hypothetical protein